MRKLFSILGFISVMLAGCNPCPASTVTGFFINVDQTPYVGPVAFSPKNNPQQIGTNTGAGATITTNLPDGILNQWLVTGGYTVRIGKLYSFDINVPNDNATYSIWALSSNLPVYVYTNSAAIYQTAVSSTDTTPGYLGVKFAAGTNIVITTNNAGGNAVLQINSTASGATGAQTPWGQDIDGAGKNLGNVLSIVANTLNGTNFSGRYFIGNFVGKATASTNADFATTAGSATTATTASTANAVSGSAALPGAQITGTVSSANLPADNAYFDVAQNWSATQTFVNTGITFGPDLGTGILQFRNRVRMQWGDVTNLSKIDFYIVNDHGGGGDNSEGQWDFNFMSFNPTATVGHVQFGLKASPGPQAFYAANYGAGTLTQQPSDFFGWQYALPWGNGFVRSQAIPFGTAGASEWVLWDPTGVPTENSNDQPTARRISAYSGIGVKVWGMQILDQTNVSTTAGGTYNVNLGGNQVQNVNITTSATIAFTNLAVLTNLSAIKPEVILYPGLGSATLTFTAPLNTYLTWAQPDGLGIAPATVPANSILDCTFLTQITGSVTNIIANYRVAPYPTAIDSTAQAFFTAAGTLSAAESNAINNWCLSSKAHGYFNNLIAFFPFVGSAATPCSKNLVNPSKYAITWHGSVSSNFTAQGIYGDGSAFYGDCAGLVPATEVTSQNSSFAAAWVRGPANPTDTGYLYGVTGANSARWGFLRNGTTAQNAGMNANTIAEFNFSSGSNFIGVDGQNRTGSTTEQDYLNSIAVGGTTGRGATTALPTSQDVYVSARNQTGTADHFSNANLNGFMVAQNMTAQNITDAIADWAQFNTTIGR